MHYYDETAEQLCQQLLAAMYGVKDFESDDVEPERIESMEKMLKRALVDAFKAGFEFGREFDREP